MTAAAEVLCEVLAVIEGLYFVFAHLDAAVSAAKFLLGLLGLGKRGESWWRGKNLSTVGLEPAPVYTDQNNIKLVKLESGSVLGFNLIQGGLDYLNDFIFVF